MKLTSFLILVMVGCMCLNLNAGQSVTFLKDGVSKTGTIKDIDDMSVRIRRVEYSDGQKIPINLIWMINFVDKKWDFPEERTELSGTTDTIFLKNGDVLQTKIVDFSEPRKKFEFEKGRPVHESKVKRIYFCCTRFPDTWKKKEKTVKRYSVTHLLNGKAIEKPLLSLNSSKTKFTDGLQINTKAIWMINFENKEWDFNNERKQLDEKVDTIFLKSGEVTHDKVIGFSKTQETFSFKSINPIHESKIKRIYFCCTKLPDAYKKKLIRFK